jgi:hypothetical protein
MTVELKSAFKMRTILGPQSGVSYSALLGAPPTAGMLLLMDYL